ncbi:MAG: rhodanese family protein [Alphaproteobacteria bacterium]|nr:rhodanese family protein [Alphaproteobacteria bacterium]
MKKRLLPLIDPREAKRLLDAGDAVLIDVREPPEWRRMRIAGSRLMSISTFDEAQLGDTGGRIAIFCCQSGNRTRAFGERLVAAGFAEAYELAGGIDSWRLAGLPVLVDHNHPIEIPRQVQIAVGIPILAGGILALVVSPWFAMLPALVGLCLVIAGITGSCSVTSLIARLPWNRAAV